MTSKALTVFLFGITKLTKNEQILYAVQGN